jgi:hypothetical protein
MMNILRKRNKHFNIFVFEIFTEKLITHRFVLLFLLFKINKIIILFLKINIELMKHLIILLMLSFELLI